MMKWLKKMLGIARRDEQIALLRELCDNLKTQLDIAPKFVTVPIPFGDTEESYKRRLSELAKDQYLNFYFMALENETLALFRDGKGEEIYRGGLRMIDRIVKDLRLAARDYEKLVQAKNNG